MFYQALDELHHKRGKHKNVDVATKVTLSKTLGENQNEFCRQISVLEIVLCLTFNIHKPPA